MNRPRIATTSPSIGGGFSWLCLRFAIWKAGGKAIRLRPNTPLDKKKIQGIVLTGGDDINPELYGEAPQDNGPYDIERDAFEYALVQRAFKEKIPVLGICRGMQMLNIASGGSLHQEVSDVFDDFFPAKSLIGKIIARRNIYYIDQCLLYRMLGPEKIHRVNSLHHQAVKRVGAAFQVVAHEKNGLVQAIEILDEEYPFCLGIQWHPEYMLWDHGNRKIFKTLVTAAQICGE